MLKILEFLKKNIRRYTTNHIRIRQNNVRKKILWFLTFCYIDIDIIDK